MPQPQPGEEHPAGQSVPAEPLRPDTEEPGDEPTEPASGRSRPDAEPATASAGDPPRTAVESPRWSGSAPVPPPTAKKWRWGGSEDERVPVPPPHEPTLELPPDEHEPPESRTPVDPWAHVDPFGDPSHPHGSVVALPPTRPFPAPPGGPPRPAPAPSIAPPQLPAPHSPAGPPPPLPPVHKPPKRGRGRGQDLSPPPPGWQAPPGYVPVPVRRRRRWPRIVALLTVLTIACCCGCPAYLGKPMWEQYPATVAVRQEIADLTLRDDATSQQTVQRLERETRTAHLLAEETFAAVYGDSARKRVVVFGTTGFRLTPESDLDEEMVRLTESYALSEVTPVDTGIRGVHEQCGVGEADGADVVVCAWADHGSLAAALFTRRSVDDSAALLGELRAALVTRG